MDVMKQNRSLKNIHITEFNHIRIKKNRVKVVGMIVVKASYLCKRASNRSQL
jgi:hypothetical protein